jgi:Fe2+ or Zn2+ uptake regulation protein
MARETTFHNTIQLRGESLKQAKQQALSQKERIFEFLKSRPGVKFTPRELHRHFPEMELTSIRRSLTDLTTEGRIQNTKQSGTTKEEVKGKPNYLWYYEQKQQIIQIKLNYE